MSEGRKLHGNGGLSEQQWWWGGGTGTSEPSDRWREEVEEEKVLFHQLPAPQSGGITASAALSLAILTTSAALSAAI